jgi:alpha-ribazole phosphatase
MSKTITFVRHGQSIYNVGIDVTMEYSKSTLSPIGDSQARLIAALLPEDASKIIVSPIERAKATAKFYCERIGKKYDICDKISEFERPKGMDKDKRKEYIEEYWSKSNIETPYGCDNESFKQFNNRVGRFIDDELQNYPDKTIIFGHGTWFAMLCFKLLGYNKVNEYNMRKFRRFQIGFSVPNGAIFYLNQYNDQWMMRADEDMIMEVSNIR